MKTNESIIEGILPEKKKPIPFKHVPEHCKYCSEAWNDAIDDCKQSLIKAFDSGVICAVPSKHEVIEASNKGNDDYWHDVEKECAKTSQPIYVAQAIHNLLLGSQNDKR